MYIVNSMHLLLPLLTKYLKPLIKWIVGIVALLIFCAYLFRSCNPMPDLPELPDVELPTVENKVEELEVDISSMTISAINAESSLGQATRTITVGTASKRYYTEGKNPIFGAAFSGSEETITLKGAEYAATYFVPGTKKVKIVGRSVVIDLNQPTWSGNPQVVKEPADEMTRDLKRRIGQLVGDTTSHLEARQELTDFVKTEFDADDELQKASTCKAAKDLIALLEEIYAQEDIKVEIVVNDSKNCPKIEEKTYTNVPLKDKEL